MNVEQIEDYMGDIRQRNGLDEHDTSRDEEFLSRDPIHNVRDYVAWTLGDTSWADFVLATARDFELSLTDFGE